MLTPTIKDAASVLMNLQVAKAVVPHAEVAEMDHVVKVAVDTKAVPAAVAIKEKAAAEVATKAAPEAVQDIAAEEAIRVATIAAVVAVDIKAVMIAAASKRRKDSTSLSLSSRKRNGRANSINSFPGRGQE